MRFLGFTFGSAKGEPQSIAPEISRAERGGFKGVGVISDVSKFPAEGMDAGEYKAQLEEIGFSEFVIQTERGSFHVPTELRAQAKRYEGKPVKFEAQSNQGLEPATVTSLSPAVN